LKFITTKTTTLWN